MKTDSIFYRIFQYYPASFFQLLSLPSITAENYEFTSIEVKQLAFRLDGLFLPKSPDQPFYLLEVQMQPDEELYHRIFAELFLYLRQYRPRQPWRIVVIYPSRTVERVDLEQFGDFITLDRVQRFYLDELETETVSVGIIKLILEPESQAIEVARNLLAQVEQTTEAQLQIAFFELIETIIVYKFPQKTREEIATMLGLGDLTQTRFYQEAFGEGRQEGRQEGRHEGLQAGLQAGEFQAKLATIRRLSKLSLPLELIAEGVGMSLAEVQRAILSQERLANEPGDDSATGL